MLPSTSLTIFLSTLWESLKWLIEKAAVPFGAAFGGAWFAYKFSKRIRREESLEKIRSYLNLIKIDVGKGKQLLQMVLDAWNANQDMILVYMPVTYFAGINLVELGRYVRATCVENIRNIHENVFSFWNTEVDELVRMMKEGKPGREVNSFFQRKLIGALVAKKPGDNYIKACDKVIGAIEEELELLKK